MKQHILSGIFTLFLSNFTAQTVYATEPPLLLDSDIISEQIQEETSELIDLEPSEQVEVEVESLDQSPEELHEVEISQEPQDSHDLEEIQSQVDPDSLPDSDFILENGTLTKYLGNETTLILPSSLQGEPITAIGEYAFQNNTTLKKITLPEGITTIDQWAFGNCTSLTEVILPNTLTKIGNMAFEFCTSLRDITLPHSLQTLGSASFYSCTSLETITIPNSVTNIENGTFYLCTSLRDITIPSSVTFIGEAILHKKENNANIPLPNLTVYGYPNSTIETYCEAHSLSFTLLTTPEEPAPESTESPTDANSPDSPEINATIHVPQSATSAGDRSTITVTPEEGYFVEEVTIKDNSGTPTTCGYNLEEDVYTFLMPESNVTVSALVTELPNTPPTHDITTQGEGTAQLDLSAPNPTEKVTLTTSPDENFATASVIITDTTGKDIQTIATSENTFSFSQPKENTNISVTFQPIETVLSTYTDIHTTEDFTPYISYATQKGFMTGTSTTVFDGNLPITRSMIAVILAKVSGESLPTSTATTFSDVSEHMWYTDSIHWISSKNILHTPSSNTFGIDDKITQEEMTDIFYHFTQYQNKNTSIPYPERFSTYSDCTSVSKNNQTAYQWALSHNLIQSSDYLLSPQNTVTRGEFSKMLYFYMNLL